MTTPARRGENVTEALPKSSGRGLGANGLFYFRLVGIAGDLYGRAVLRGSKSLQIAVQKRLNVFHEPIERARLFELRNQHLLEGGLRFDFLLHFGGLQESAAQVVYCRP